MGHAIHSGRWLQTADQMFLQLSRLLMFDAEMIVKQLQAETRQRRKKPYRRNKSRLDRYRMEILALRRHVLLHLKFSVGYEKKESVLF